MSLTVIGISIHSHESACCLLHDGVLLSAAQEERFTRKKSGGGIPGHAFKWCLQHAGLSICDIDVLAYYEDPAMKRGQQQYSASGGNSKGAPDGQTNRLEGEIRKLLGYTGPIEVYGYPLSQAASAFYYSGFDEAAIMTHEGVGEWGTATYSYGRNLGIQVKEKIRFPHSIGLMYSTVAAYLGYQAIGQENLLMDVAPYGKPKYVEELRRLVKRTGGDRYEAEQKYFYFTQGQTMFSEELIQLFGRKEGGHPATEVTPFHLDMANSLQVVLEEMLLENVSYLHNIAPSRNLCLAGSLALNAAANRRLIQDGPFECVFIPPSTDNSGAALGAAALAYVRRAGTAIAPLENASLGPEYPDMEICRMLEAASLVYEDFRNNREQLLHTTARLLESDKIVGWFQGRMEFGSMALGNRSILADPRKPHVRERIIRDVKKSEFPFPSTISILEDKTGGYVDSARPSPFMLLTANVTSDMILPGVSHLDRSARVQTVCEAANPLFAGLIREFERRTSCPLLLNTSFNREGEPFVESPVDALCCFISTDMDALVIGSFIVHREKNQLDFMRNVLLDLEVPAKRFPANRYPIV
ncbi:MULTISPECIES: carbamoyltransferase family protein [unclassified Paenibacillus]|uniref:carbamoyltransferase family protein n=1 Tax=unclassified Paenibacillus TaxID=185978 RepID=UPI0030F7EAC2